MGVSISLEANSKQNLFRRKINVRLNSNGAYDFFVQSDLAMYRARPVRPKWWE